MPDEPVLTERQAISVLVGGGSPLVRGIGNSMTPILRSGQVVRVNQIGSTPIKKGDVVLCKVRGNVYLHKVTAVRGDQYQISNNHGHVNGWVGIGSIYGRASI